MITSRWKIALLLSYVCIASMSAAVITPALPQIQHSFGLHSGTIEWVISLFLLGYVIGQLLYGPLANRFGRIAALRLGLLINLVGIVICLLAAQQFNYHWLLFGRFITALGAASGLVCTFLLINELLPEPLVKVALSFVVISFTLGSGLAVTLGGVLTEYSQWQDCLWFLLIHGLLMLIGTWCFAEPDYQVKALTFTSILRGYRDALASSQLLIFSLLLGFISSFTYCFAATAPIYSQNSLHLTPSQYGYWNLLNIAGMLGSGLLGAKLIKRFAPSKVLIIGLALTLLPLMSLIGLAMKPQVSVAWFFASTSAMFLFNGTLFPVGSYYATNAITDKASASGMMSFINMASSMLCVIIVGYLPLSPIHSLVLIALVFYTLVITLLFTKYISGIIKVFGWGLDVG